MDMCVEDVFQFYSQFLQKLEVSIEFIFYWIDDDPFQCFWVKEQICTGLGVPVKELPVPYIARCIHDFG